MESLSQWLVDHLVLGILVMTRLSTLLMAMPAVGVGVPKRVRALLAIVLTVLVLPSVANTTPPGQLPPLDNLVDLTIAIAREALIGMLIGATIQLIITGIQLGGEAITSTSGMQLGDAVDPTSASNMPSIARMIGLLVTAVMLLVGGHRIVLGLLMESFTALPAGQVVFHDSMLEMVVGQLGSGTAAGVRVAAPVVAALLLSNVITGLISRTLPQINVLAIGLSINALAMLVVLALSIGSAGLVFREELVLVAERIRESW